MMKTTIILFVLALALVAQVEDEAQTREQLFAPITDPILNPERRYAEFDLDGDGTNDLVLSESVSLGGTGGLVYNMYVGVGQGRFKKLDQILAGAFAVEVHGQTKRLWSYSHCSSQSGTIQYCYFDRKGRFKKSQALMIHPGDGGSEIGNAVYESIFNKKTILKTKRIGASNKPDAGDGK